ncbi:hypothetical protein KBF38_23710 [bacterium]|nr:hypothetical protein [bacterium]
MSQFHYLTDEEIASAITDGAQSLRACLLDSVSAYLVLTIPEASEYRQSLPLSQLLGNLSEVGVLPRLYKAAGSDDAQIFIAFSAPVKTEEIAHDLGVYLGKCGFKPAPGSLTIHSDQVFPIPLQPGFCWLNESFEPKLHRDEVSLPAAMAIFLRDIETAAVCPVSLQTKLARAEAICAETSEETRATRGPSETSFDFPPDVDEVGCEEIKQSHQIILNEDQIAIAEPKPIAESTLLPEPIHSEVLDFLAIEVEPTIVSNEPNSDSILDVADHRSEETDQLLRMTLAEALPTIAQPEQILEQALIPESLQSNGFDFPATEVEFTDKTVGMQLLLFSTDLLPEISALPKGRPKRGKKPRSSLPDSSDSASPAQTKFFPIELPGNLAQSSTNQEGCERQ